jgi:hypothetical protein
MFLGYNNHIIYKKPMKNNIYKACSIMILALLAVSYADTSLASPPPALTLSNSGSSVQVVVSNADSNATVMFYYPTGGTSSTNTSVNIGQTNASGYLSTSINTGSYGLVTGNPVFVSVNGIQSANLAWPSSSNVAPAALVLSQSTATVTIGQSITVNASNITGTLSIPGNTNPSVASVSINGNSIIINGSSSGNAIITVCASQSGCSSLNVTVQPSYLGSSGVYLNPSSISFNVGQSQTISITGYASGPYYVSQNSGSNYVSATISGSNIILTGLATGSSNVTVCANSGQCGSVFANISGNNNTTGNNTTTVSNQAPVLSSVTISSSAGSNSFIGTGNIISFNLLANQSINNPVLTIGGKQISTNGSGNGPYTASYSVTGTESIPIPVAITLANSSGQTGQAYLWLSNYSSAAPANTTTAVSSATTVAPTVSGGSHSFTRYLYMGMTLQGVSDPDVTALQNRLKADGLYSAAVTGYFGPYTKSTLEAYQTKHSLSAIGVVGPSTRDLLNRGI